MSDEWGPTQYVPALNRARLQLPEGLAYVFRTDRLVCCGCVVHSGPEASDCECRCHWAARMIGNPQFVKVKR